MGKTLLIMAAGLASRYGGNKQTDGLGPHGEILMEYSIRDARKHGFDCVVFVIARSMERTFPDMMRERIEGMRLEFAVQDYSTLPGWYRAPAARTKPFGTVHAVLAAKHLLAEPFAVINADDFYGEQAFADLAAALDALKAEHMACMLAYPLCNTLSCHGTVTRGVCKVENGVLRNITETYAVKQCEDGIIRSFDQSEQGTVLDANVPVSMNIFGFMPWLLTDMQHQFEEFLRGLAPDEVKKEYPLPVFLDKMIQSGALAMQVVLTDSQWFGVTYQEDRDVVRALLKNLDC